MANWSNPTLTSLYTDFVTEVKNRDVDLALGLDPATTSPTNVPTNAIRWNSASYKYERWNGSAWGDLSSKYIFTAVEVNGATVPANGMYLSATNTLNFATATTPSRLTIDASGNVNIDAGTLYVDAAGNRTGINNTSPGSYNASADDLVVGLTGDTGVTIVSGTSSQGSIFFADGTTGGAQQAAGYLYYLHSNDSMVLGTANTARLTLDASGNLGLGVTPSAWYSGARAMQVGNTSIAQRSSSESYIGQNFYTNSSNAFTYTQTGYAGMYGFYNGQHLFYTAPSGTAGNAITFTQAMTLNASGSLLLGTTSSRGNFYNSSSGYDLYMQVESINYGAGCSYVRNSPDSASAVLLFGKTRSGSLGGNAVVANNDNIGTISFQGSDGSEFVPAASITARVDGTPGANDMPGRLVFATTADGAASPTDRMTLNASGNLGIGTTGPTFKLDVKMSGSARTDGLVIRRSDNDNHQLGLWTAGGVMYFDAVTDNPSAAGQTIFRRSLDSGSTFNESARLDSSGRLLVGTSTTGGISNARLQVAQTSNYCGEFTQYSNDAYGSYFFISKSRGAVGSQGLVQSGDEIGVIGFSASDGTAYRTAALIQAAVDATPGTNDMPGRLVFSTTADGAASPTERVRLNNAGYLKTSNTGTYVASASNTHEFNNDQNGISVLRIHASSATYNNNVLYASCARATTNGSFYLIYAANGNTSGQFAVLDSGNVQNTNNSYTAISDLKLKENVVDASSQWADLKALRVRNYNLKEGQTHRQIGLIAQEVEPISPGLVYESPDRDAEGNDLGTVTKSVNYSVLYMKAVKALQEAMERIETLEAKVAALEAS